MFQQRRIMHAMIWIEQAKKPYKEWTPVASIATDVHRVSTIPRGSQPSLALRQIKCTMYEPMAVMPSGYMLFCGTVNSPEAFIHRTMHVCVEKASNAPPIIQKIVNIQLNTGD
jgi:hypothetical protein